MVEGAVVTWWQGFFSYFHPLLLWHWLTGSQGLFYRLYRNVKSGFDPRFRRRRRLLSWVEQAAGRDVLDLAMVWRDGSILCEVIHRACPAACQGWEESESKDTFRHAQALVYRCLQLDPAFSEQELSRSELTPNIEKRLFRYVQAIKLAISKRHHTRSLEDESEGEALIAEEYIARGMGLIMASRRQPAIFYIYSRDGSSLMDIHIEVRGPGDDFGSALVSQVDNNMSSHCSIPIEYKLTPEYLRVSYQPRSVGHHELSVSRHGYIVPGSPFVVTVDEITERQPHKRFNSIEWYTEDEDRRQQDLQEKKKNAKVKFRVVDFVTEKMILTDDGKLVKISPDVQDCASSPPPDFPAPLIPQITTSLEPPPSISPSPTRSCESISSSCKSRRSISPKSRTKRANKCKWVNVKPDAMKYILVKPQKAEIKRVSDAASQVTLDIQNNIFQDKCKRIVNVCNYLLRHCPRQKSLEIISGAGHILQTGMPKKNTARKTKKEQTTVTEVSDEDDEVFIRSPPLSPTVTTMMYPERCRSISLSFVNNKLTDSTENVAEDVLENTISDRRGSQDSGHLASAARKSFRCEGNTKSPRRRMSFSSITAQQDHDPNFRCSESVNTSDLVMVGDIINSPSNVIENQNIKSEIALIKHSQFEDEVLEIRLSQEHLENKFACTQISSESELQPEILDTKSDCLQLPTSICEEDYTLENEKKITNSSKENLLTPGLNYEINRNGVVEPSVKKSKVAVDIFNLDTQHIDNNSKSNQHQKTISKSQVENKVAKRVSTTKGNLVKRIIAHFEASVGSEIDKEKTENEETTKLYRDSIPKPIKPELKNYIVSGIENEAIKVKLMHIEDDLQIEYLKSIGANVQCISTIKPRIEMFEKSKQGDNIMACKQTAGKSQHSSTDYVGIETLDKPVLEETKEHVFRAEPAVVVSKHYAELRDISLHKAKNIEAIIFDFKSNSCIGSQSAIESEEKNLVTLQAEAQTLNDHDNRNLRVNEDAKYEPTVVALVTEVPKDPDKQEVPILNQKNTAINSQSPELTQKNSLEKQNLSELNKGQLENESNKINQQSYLDAISNSRLKEEKREIISNESSSISGKEKQFLNTVTENVNEPISDESCIKSITKKEIFSRVGESTCGTIVEEIKVTIAKEDLYSKITEKDDKTDISNDLTKKETRKNICSYNLLKKQDDKKNEFEWNKCVQTGKLEENIEDISTDYSTNNNIDLKLLSVTEEMEESLTNEQLLKNEEECAVFSNVTIQTDIAITTDRASDSGSITKTMLDKTSPENNKLYEGLTDQTKTDVPDLTDIIDSNITTQSDMITKKKDDITINLLQKSYLTGNEKPTKTIKTTREDIVIEDQNHISSKLMEGSISETLILNNTEKMIIETSICLDTEEFHSKPSPCVNIDITDMANVINNLDKQKGSSFIPENEILNEKGDTVIASEAISINNTEEYINNIKSGVIIETCPMTTAINQTVQKCTDIIIEVPISKTKMDTEVNTLIESTELFQETALENLLLGNVIENQELVTNVVENFCSKIEPFSDIISKNNDTIHAKIVFESNLNVLSDNYKSFIEENTKSDIVKLKHDNIFELTPLNGAVKECTQSTKSKEPEETGSENIPLTDELRVKTETIFDDNTKETGGDFIAYNIVTDEAVETNDIEFTTQTGSKDIHSNNDLKEDTEISESMLFLESGLELHTIKECTGNLTNPLSLVIDSSLLPPSCMKEQVNIPALNEIMKSTVPESEFMNETVKEITKTAITENSVKSITEITPLSSFILRDMATFVDDFSKENSSTDMLEIQLLCNKVVTVVNKKESGTEDISINDAIEVGKDSVMNELFNESTSTVTGPNEIKNKKIIETVLNKEENTTSIKLIEESGSEVVSLNSIMKKESGNAVILETEETGTQHSQLLTGTAIVKDTDKTIVKLADKSHSVVLPKELLTEDLESDIKKVAEENCSKNLNVVGVLKEDTKILMNEPFEETSSGFLPQKSVISENFEIINATGLEDIPMNEDLKESTKPIKKEVNEFYLDVVNLNGTTRDTVILDTDRDAIPLNSTAEKCGSPVIYDLAQDFGSETVVFNEALREKVEAIKSKDIDDPGSATNIDIKVIATSFNNINKETRPSTNLLDKTLAGEAKILVTTIADSTSSEDKPTNDFVEGIGSIESKVGKEPWSMITPDYFVSTLKEETGTTDLSLIHAKANDRDLVPAKMTDESLLDGLTKNYNINEDKKVYTNDPINKISSESLTLKQMEIDSSEATFKKPTVENNVESGQIDGDFKEETETILNENCEATGAVVINSIRIGSMAVENGKYKPRAEFRLEDLQQNNISNDCTKENIEVSIKQDIEESSLDETIVCPHYITRTNPQAVVNNLMMETGADELPANNTLANNNVAAINCITNVTGSETVLEGTKSAINEEYDNPFSAGISSSDMTIKIKENFVNDPSNKKDTTAVSEDVILERGQEIIINIVTDETTSDEKPINDLVKEAGDNMNIEIITKAFSTVASVNDVIEKQTEPCIDKLTNKTISGKYIYTKKDYDAVAQETVTGFVPLNSSMVSEKTKSEIIHLASSREKISAGSHALPTNYTIEYVPKIDISELAKIEDSEMLLLSDTSNIVQQEQKHTTFVDELAQDKKESPISQATVEIYSGLTPNNVDGKNIQNEPITFSGESSLADILPMKNLKVNTHIDTNEFLNEKTNPGVIYLQNTIRENKDSIGTQLVEGISHLLLQNDKMEMEETSSTQEINKNSSSDTVFLNDTIKEVTDPAFIDIFEESCSTVALANVSVVSDLSTASLEKSKKADFVVIAERKIIEKEAEMDKSSLEDKPTSGDSMNGEVLKENCSKATSLKEFDKKETKACTDTLITNQVLDANVITKDHDKIFQENVSEFDTLNSSVVKQETLIKTLTEETKPEVIHLADVKERGTGGIHILQKRYEVEEEKKIDLSVFPKDDNNEADVSDSTTKEGSQSTTIIDKFIQDKNESLISQSSVQKENGVLLVNFVDGVNVENPSKCSELGDITREDNIREEIYTFTDELPNEQHSSESLSTYNATREDTGDKQNVLEIESDVLLQNNKIEMGGSCPKLELTEDINSSTVLLNDNIREVTHSVLIENVEEPDSAVIACNKMVSKDTPTLINDVREANDSIVTSRSKIQENAAEKEELGLEDKLTNDFIEEGDDAIREVTHYVLIETVEEPDPAVISCNEMVSKDISTRINDVREANDSTVTSGSKIQENDAEKEEPGLEVIPTYDFIEEGNDAIKEVTHSVLIETVEEPDSAVITCNKMVSKDTPTLINDVREANDSIVTSRSKIQENAAEKEELGLEDKLTNDFIEEGDDAIREVTHYVLIETVEEPDPAVISCNEMVSKDISTRINDVREANDSTVTSGSKIQENDAEKEEPGLKDKPTNDFIEEGDDAIREVTQSVLIETVEEPDPAVISCNEMVSKDISTLINDVREANDSTVTSGSKIQENDAEKEEPGLKDKPTNDFIEEGNDAIREVTHSVLIETVEEPDPAVIACNKMVSKDTPTLINDVREANDSIVTSRSKIQENAAEKEELGLEDKLTNDFIEEGDDAIREVTHYVLIETVEEPDPAVISCNEMVSKDISTCINDVREANDSTVTSGSKIQENDAEKEEPGLKDKPKNDFIEDGNDAIREVTHSVLIETVEEPDPAVISCNEMVSKDISTLINDVREANDSIVTSGSKIQENDAEKEEPGLKDKPTNDFIEDGNDAIREVTHSVLIETVEEPGSAVIACNEMVSKDIKTLINDVREVKDSIVTSGSKIQENDAEKEEPDLEDKPKNDFIEEGINSMNEELLKENFSTFAFPGTILENETEACTDTFTTNQVLGAEVSSSNDKILQETVSELETIISSKVKQETFINKLVEETKLEVIHSAVVVEKGTDDTMEEEQKIYKSELPKDDDNKAHVLNRITKEDSKNTALIDELVQDKNERLISQSFVETESGVLLFNNVDEERIENYKIKYSNGKDLEYVSMDNILEKETYSFTNELTYEQPSSEFVPTNYSAREYTNTVGKQLFVECESNDILQNDKIERGESSLILELTEDIITSTEILNDTIREVTQTLLIETVDEPGSGVITCSATVLKNTPTFMRDIREETDSTLISRSEIQENDAEAEESGLEDKPTNDFFEDGRNSINDDALKENVTTVAFPNEILEKEIPICTDTLITNQVMDAEMTKRKSHDKVMQETVSDFESLNPNTMTEESKPEVIYLVNKIEMGTGDSHMLPNIYNEEEETKVDTREIPMDNDYAVHLLDDVTKVGSKNTIQTLIKQPNEETEFGALSSNSADIENMNKNKIKYSNVNDLEDSIIDKILKEEKYTFTDELSNSEFLCTNNATRKDTNREGKQIVVESKADVLFQNDKMDMGESSPILKLTEDITFSTVHLNDTIREVTHSVLIETIEEPGSTVITYNELVSKDITTLICDVREETDSIVSLGSKIQDKYAEREETGLEDKPLSDIFKEGEDSMDNEVLNFSGIALTNKIVEKETQACTDIIITNQVLGAEMNTRKSHDKILQETDSDLQSLNSSIVKQETSINTMTEEINSEVIHLAETIEKSMGDTRVLPKSYNEEEETKIDTSELPTDNNNEVDVLNSIKKESSKNTTIFDELVQDKNERLISKSTMETESGVLLVHNVDGENTEKHSNGQGLGDIFMDKIIKDEIYTFTDELPHEQPSSELLSIYYATKENMDDKQKVVESESDILLQNCLDKALINSVVESSSNTLQSNYILEENTKTGINEPTQVTGSDNILLNETVQDRLETTIFYKFNEENLSEKVLTEITSETSLEHSILEVDLKEAAETVLQRIPPKDFNSEDSSTNCTTGLKTDQVIEQCNLEMGTIVLSPDITIKDIKKGCINEVTKNLDLRNDALKDSMREVTKYASSEDSGESDSEIIPSTNNIEYMVGDISKSSKEISTTTSEHEIFDNEAELVINKVKKEGIVIGNMVQTVTNTDVKELVDNVCPRLISTKDSADLILKELSNTAIETPKNALRKEIEEADSEIIPSTGKVMEEIKSDINDTIEETCSTFLLESKTEGKEVTIQILTKKPASEDDEIPKVTETDIPQLVGEGHSNVGFSKEMSRDDTGMIVNVFNDNIGLQTILDTPLAEDVEESGSGITPSTNVVIKDLDFVMTSSVEEISSKILLANTIIVGKEETAVMNILPKEHGSDDIPTNSLIEDGPSIDIKNLATEACSKCISLEGIGDVTIETLKYSAKKVTDIILTKHTQESTSECFPSTKIANNIAKEETDSEIIEPIRDESTTIMSSKEIRKSPDIIIEKLNITPAEITKTTLSEDINKTYVEPVSSANLETKNIESNISNLSEEIIEEVSEESMDLITENLNGLDKEKHHRPDIYYREDIPIFKQNSNSTEQQLSDNEEESTVSNVFAKESPLAEILSVLSTTLVETEESQQPTKDILVKDLSDHKNTRIEIGTNELKSKDTNPFDNILDVTVHTESLHESCSTKSLLAAMSEISQEYTEIDSNETTAQNIILPQIETLLTRNNFIVASDVHEFQSKPDSLEHKILDGLLHKHETTFYQSTPNNDEVSDFKTSDTMLDKPQIYDCNVSVSKETDSSASLTGNTLNNKENYQTYSARELYLQLISNINTPALKNSNENRDSLQTFNCKLETSENPDLNNTKTNVNAQTSEQSNFSKTSNLNSAVYYNKYESFNETNIIHEKQNSTIKSKIQHLIFSDSNEYTINNENIQINSTFANEQDPFCFLTSFSTTNSDKREKTAEKDIEFSDRPASPELGIVSSVTLNKRQESFTDDLSTVQLMKQRFENPESGMYTKDMSVKESNQPNTTEIPSALTTEKKNFIQSLLGDCKNDDSKDLDICSSYNSIKSIWENYENPATSSISQSGNQKVPFCRQENIKSFDSNKHSFINREQRNTPLKDTCSSPETRNNESFEQTLSVESETLNKNLITVEQELSKVLNIASEEIDNEIQLEIDEIDAMDSLGSANETTGLNDQTNFNLFLDIHADQSDILSIEDETMDIDVQKEITDLESLPNTDEQDSTCVENCFPKSKKLIRVDSFLLNLDLNYDETCNLEEEKLDEKIIEEISVVDTSFEEDQTFDNGIKQKTPEVVCVVKPRLILVEPNLKDMSLIGDEELDDELQKELDDIDNMVQINNKDESERASVEQSSETAFYTTYLDIEHVDSNKTSNFTFCTDNSSNLDSNLHDAINTQHDMNNYEFFKSSSSYMYSKNTKKYPFHQNELESLEPSFDSLQSGLSGAGESYSDKLALFNENNLSISTESDGSDFNAWSSNVEFGDPTETTDQEGMDLDSIISAPNLSEALKKLEAHIQDKGEDIQWLSVRTPSPSLQSLEKYFKDDVPCFDTEKFYVEVSGGLLPEKTNTNGKPSVENLPCVPLEETSSHHEELPECSYAPGSIESKECETDNQENEPDSWIISPFQYPRVLLANTDQMSIIVEEDDQRKSQPPSPLQSCFQDISFSSEQCFEESKLEQHFNKIEFQDNVQREIGEIDHTMAEFDRLVSRPSVDESTMGLTNQDPEEKVNQLQFSNVAEKYVLTESHAYFDNIESYHHKTTYGTSANTVHQDVELNYCEGVKRNEESISNDHHFSDLHESAFKYINNKLIKEENSHIKQENNVREEIKFLLEGNIDSISEDTLNKLNVTERTSFWDKKLQMIQELDIKTIPSSGPKSLSNIKSGTVQELVSCFADNHDNVELTPSLPKSQSINSKTTGQGKVTEVIADSQKHEGNATTIKRSPLKGFIDGGAMSVKPVSQWKAYWDDIITEQCLSSEKEISKVHKVPLIQISVDGEENAVSTPNEHMKCTKNDVPNVSNEISLLPEKDSRENVITNTCATGSVLQNIKKFSECSILQLKSNGDPLNELKSKINCSSSFNTIIEKDNDMDSKNKQHSSSSFLLEPMFRTRSYSEGHLETNKTATKENIEKCTQETEISEDVSIGQQNEFRIRFERAKYFFKQLESLGPGEVKERDYRSMPRLDLVLPTNRKQSIDSDSGADVKPQKRRDRYRNRRKKRKNTSNIQSAPTSDTETAKRIQSKDSFDSFGGSVKSIKVYERFHVKDLFRDVSGRVGLFRGIPNQAAVLASLKSVDDVRPLSPYQMDYIDPRSASLGNIPAGFQNEYPYLPTTPANQFRPRSALEFNLIPRNQLLDEDF